MNNNYRIPIIPQNLDKHETIIQISEAFQYLSDVTDTIFSQINKKMQIDETKVSALSERINMVSMKINQLKGSTTATQVFSSSKYPASDINQDYVSIFHDCPPVEYKRSVKQYKNFHSTHEPLEKLQLYHVNVPQEVQRTKLEGLQPEKVDFINDLHIIPSGKDLYKKYETNVALRNSKNKDDNISKIDEAPHSISDKVNMSRSVTQDYMYAPQIGEVPALEVPLDLPDLPGIADNLHYENDLGPAIAPSAFIESLKDLPTIESSEFEPVTIPASISIPPPPPPNELLKTIIELPKPPTEPFLNSPTQQVELPKPPVELPEPPKHTNNLPEVTDETPENKIGSNQFSPPSDLRSSLMEAIKNAGGSGKAKLKSVTSRIEKEEESTTIQGGDLMADLHKKLFMRRKGISGVKKAEENAIDPHSTLGKISAMIPSPEKLNADAVSNDEEDWE